MTAGFAATAERNSLVRIAPVAEKGALIAVSVLWSASFMRRKNASGFYILHMYVMDAQKTGNALFKDTTTRLVMLRENTRKLCPRPDPAFA